MCVRSRWSRSTNGLRIEKGVEKSECVVEVSTCAGMRCAERCAVGWLEELSTRGACREFQR